MHPIYHTDAIIIGSVSRGEANRVYLLLTKDMGAFYATAQGVRLERSKLRYTLQDFSYIRVDLVRGRDVWRITSATPQETFSLVYGSERGMRFLHAIQKLLTRLVRGEVSHPKVFSDMLTALRFLNSVNSTAVYTAVELTLMLRILHELGYVSPKEPFGDFLGGDFTPESLLPESFPKEAVLEEIRKAVEESQL